ncbi:phosphate ABC transporter substrate-binding protein [Thalassolituus maritimus]|jgi:ABC-type phosphate transport system substrate-binding protein|uniref:Phosphate ABC transporter substrate-binding protein n=1 Tax=Thalassolituus maritimus TaxID=484498 RepID=A0ABP9ZY00_9GAMM|nr:phosphate ABC transporter substrate-binding protein [Pseudomonadota bacterium]
MKLIKQFSLVVGLLAAILVPAVSVAGIAVIVHPSNEAGISESDIKKIYLGKSTKFPNDADAEPLDQKEGSDVRQQFLDAAVGKSEPQMKSHWSRLIFTGKGVPPKSLSSDADVVSAVAGDPNAIGFVDSSAVTDAVKVVHTY